jgi:integrase
MIIKLTQKMIDHDLQQYINGKRTELVSDERSGLYIEVRPSGNGVGTYYLRYKNGEGKSCHERLGRTNVISLADARQKAATFRLELDKSPDLSKTTPIITSDKLLRDFWVEYIAFAKSTKRSWKRDEQLYRIRIMPRFGHLKLSEIKVRQIQTLMMDIREEGLASKSADQHGQLMRRMGNLAVKWGYLDVNFANGIQLYHEFNQVENIPTDEQMAKLIHVLKTDANRAICNIVLFLLNTGCRLGEALTLQWSHLAVDEKVWTVPSKSSKSKRPRQVLLTDSALNLLKQIDRKESDVYVFTNRKTNKHYVQIFKPWNRLRKKAGLPKLRLHDLRHSFASILVNNGASLYQVSQLLGHADTRVTQRYAHLSTETLLTAANAVSDKLSSLKQPQLEVVKSGKAA